MSLVVSQGVLYVKYCGKFIATESTVEEFDAMEREIRHLRIAHLRRMLSSIPGAVERMKWYCATTEAEYERKKWRRRDQFARFGKAINAEITRLTNPR